MAHFPHLGSAGSFASLSLTLSKTKHVSLYDHNPKWEYGVAEDVSRPNNFFVITFPIQINQIEQVFVPSASAASWCSCHDGSTSTYISRGFVSLNVDKCLFVIHKRWRLGWQRSIFSRSRLPDRLLRTPPHKCNAQQSLSKCQQSCSPHPWALQEGGQKASAAGGQKLTGKKEHKKSPFYFLSAGKWSRMSSPGRAATRRHFKVTTCCDYCNIFFFMS